MRTGTSYFKTFSKMMWLFALLLVVFTAGCDRDHGVGGPPGPAGAAPNLGLASTYGIIAYNAITIGGISHIYGDAALTGPTGTSTSVTGAGASNGGALPSLTSTGVTNSNGVTPGIVDSTDNGNAAILPQLQADLNAAYLDLSSRVAPTTPLTIPVAAGASGGTFVAPSPDLSGSVLGPGIYKATATIALGSASGPLVLDAEGNPDAVFVFQASDISTTTGSVILQNDAQPKNVFWVMTATATIGNGASTFFQGTIVAGGTITVGATSNVEGRMLAGALGAGAITLNGSIVTVPLP